MKYSNEKCPELVKHLNEKVPVQANIWLQVPDKDTSQKLLTSCHKMHR